MFDAKHYLEMLEFPKFVDPTGKLHVGRLLGADSWIKFQDALRTSKDAQGNEVQVGPAQLKRTLQMLTDETFPRPWYKPWEKRVSDWIKTLPLQGQVDAVWDFIKSQGKAAGLTLSTSRALGASLPVSPSELLVSPTAGSLPSSI